ncbi:MAG: DUF4037 domain-containing protein [Clostridiales bacterium]|nr:DUF4037 domain-containing protein [Clostridiales bacterium]
MYSHIEGLIKDYKELDEVEAFVVGGSRATGKYDKKSDYDVYIYVNSVIPKDTRKNILSKYCKYMEIENCYFEMEDDCTLNNGIDIDIIYRNLDDFEKEIKSVVSDFNSSNGYTTCMWHNLLTSDIVFDKDGTYGKIKERYNVPYPKKLKENIISKNFNLLSGVLPSYDMQIKKAISRNDMVSINHRVTEFIASYFDIIFAINEMTHPGEKRLMSICKEQCKILPNNFEENLTNLFNSLYKGEIVNDIIKSIVQELSKIILQ